MVRKQQNLSESEPSKRKRGRPSGRNRVPLSLEERRARNAQYERERRNEKSGAMAQLAEAVGCDPSIATTDLLATVINRIQRAAEIDSAEDIEKLRRINGNLMSQIDKLESQLMLLCPEFDGTNIDDLSEQSETSSDLVNQPCSSGESTNRFRTKKNSGKRKRKSNKRKESDSQYSSDFQSESSSECNLAKRIKTEMETNETHNGPEARRITRSSHTSHSSYEVALDGMTENDAPTFEQITSDEQSLSYHPTQQVESIGSTPENPQWMDSNMTVDLELPQIPVELISNADYMFPELNLQEPHVQYSTDLTYSPLTIEQDQVVESQVQIPLQYGLQPDEIFEIPSTHDFQLINDSDWFDSNFFMNTENIGDNLLLS